VLHTVQMFGVATNNVPFPFQHQFIPVTLQWSGLIELKCNAGQVWMNANVLVVKHPYGDRRSRIIQTLRRSSGRIRNRSVARRLVGFIGSEGPGCRCAGGSQAADV
jgi:hypothetical protein